MTDHQPPPAVEAIGRLEECAASESAHWGSFATPCVDVPVADLRALLSFARHSVELEAGLREALADLADVLRNSVKERDGPHRVKVEGVWHEGPLADVYVRTFDQIVGILGGLLLSPTPPSTGAEK